MWMVPSFLLDSVVLFVGFMVSDFKSYWWFSFAFVCWVMAYKVVIYAFVTELPNLFEKQAMNHVLFISICFVVWFSGLVNVSGILWMGVCFVEC